MKTPVTEDAVVFRPWCSVSTHTIDHPYALTKLPWPIEFLQTFNFFAVRLITHFSWNNHRHPHSSSPHNHHLVNGEHHGSNLSMMGDLDGEIHHLADRGREGWKMKGSNPAPNTWSIRLQWHLSSCLILPTAANPVRCHQCGVCKFLQICWQDKWTNVSILSQTNNTSSKGLT